jgi:hypothetical protein
MISPNARRGISRRAAPVFFFATLRIPAAQARQSIPVAAAVQGAPATHAINHVGLAGVLHLFN